MYNIFYIYVILVVRYKLPVLGNYNIHNVNYRFSVLAMNTRFVRLYGEVNRIDFAIAM